MTKLPLVGPHLGARRTWFLCAFGGTRQGAALHDRKIVANMHYPDRYLRAPGASKFARTGGARGDQDALLPARSTQQICIAKAARAHMVCLSNPTHTS